MHKLFRTLALLISAMLVVYMVGCGGGGDDEDILPPPALVVTASPASGSSVPQNAVVSLTFDKAVDAVAGATEGSGKNWKIAVAANLVITWTNKDGSQGGPENLTYTLLAPDTKAPEITGGNVKNGDKDVEPGPLNADKIQITFNENVSGTAELNFEDGTTAGWQGVLTDANAELTPVAGKELANSVTYIVVLSVADAAGNKASFNIEFTTKAKE
jgi:hypothetical protein